MTLTKHQKFYSESLKLIYRKGFKATTMRDIADRMECDVANIYNYIDSKQDLLERFLFEMSKQFHIGIDDILASSYTPVEKMRHLVRLNVQLSIQKPLEISLLVNEWRNLKEPMLKRFLKERKQYEQKVKRLLVQSMHAGEVRKMDSDMATHLLLSSMRWLFDKQVVGKKRLNPVEVEKEVFEFLNYGFGV